MRDRRWTVHTLVVLTCATATASGADAAAASSCRGTQVPVQSWEGLVPARTSVRCLVGEARRGAGLPALRANRRLEGTAVRHGSDMVRRSYFAHDTPEGRSFVSRVRAGRYGPPLPWRAGEVLATGSDGGSTPAALVSSLLASPPHRRILLDGGLRELGLGVVWGTADTAGPRAGMTLVMVLGRRG